MKSFERKKRTRRCPPEGLAITIAFLLLGLSRGGSDRLVALAFVVPTSTSTAASPSATVASTMYKSKASFSATTDGITARRTAATALRAAAPSRVAPEKKEEETKKSSKPSSRRVRFLNHIGFLRTSKDNYEMHHDVGQQKQQQERGAVAIRIATLAQLEEHWQDQGGRFRDARTGEVNYNRLLRSASVMGDTQVIGSKDHPEYTHPVLKLLHERRRNRLRQQEQQHRYRPLPLSSTVVEDNADAGNDINGLGDVGVASSAACGEGDRCKIALAIEGGGMRGCISAGMVGAIHHLGLTDSFDVVYGSSAGTIVGAYLITGQLPWFGPEVYYDCLTTAGKGFIDTRRLLRSLGFGLLDPRLLKDVLTRPAGKPVLNLSYLLQTTLQGIKPVDWDKFVQRQADIPLKIVASGCRSERAVVLDMQNRAFESLPELADCMHASCLLPGIAGPLMNLDRRAIEDPSAFAAAPGSKKLQLGNNLQGDHLEPLADALLFEPLPFRSAVREGATHVLVLRSRPDGTDVTGKGGIFEQLIFRRFFLRKNRLPNMFKRLKMQLHKKVYAEGVIELNEAARDDRDYLDTSAPHLMTIALEPGSKEISRLETGRAAIFDGMRRGFARAYDCLVEDPSERGRGMIVAKEFFPDEILDYDPLEIEGGDLFESAFATYLRQKGITPRSWRERQDDAYCHKSGEVNEYRR